MNKHGFERLIILALSIVVGLLVALQLKSVTNASRRVNTDGLQLTDIRNQLNDMIAQNEQLNLRNQNLNQALLEIENQSAQSDAQLNFYRNEILRYQTFAGLNNVQGPGGIIRIEVTGDSAVTAAELLVIINELRASGVEAMSINDQRVVAMTEIRSLGAGADIQMNGVRLTADEGYTIRAIGDPDKVRSAMDFLTETVARMRIDGKNVTASYPDQVTIPALSETSPVYRQGLMDAVEDE